MSLLRLQPARHARWPIGTQAALAIALPIIVATLAGRPEIGYQAATGAFTVLFAGAAPAAERARILPFVAAALVACAAAGVALGGSPALTAIGTVLVAFGGAAAVYGFSLGPPGPVFFVLLYGLSASLVAGTWWIPWDTSSLWPAAASSRTCSPSLHSCSPAAAACGRDRCGSCCPARPSPRPNACSFCGS